MREQPTDAFEQLASQIDPGEAAVFKVIDKIEGVEGKTLRIENLHVKEDPKDPVKRPAWAKAHKFNDLGGFIDYIRKYGHGGDVVVLADMAVGLISATLAEDSKKEVEEISYAPMVTIEHSEVIKLDTGPLSVRDFSKSLRRIRDYITYPDQKLITMMIGQLSVAKEVEDFSSVGTKGTFGKVVKVKARAGDGQNVEVPEFLKLTFLPYIDSIKAVTVKVYIDLVPRGDGAFFEFDTSELSSIFQKAMKSQMPVLVEELKDFALVTAGRSSRVRWNYLT